MGRLFFEKSKTPSRTPIEHHTHQSNQAFSLFSETIDKLLDANHELSIDIDAAKQRAEDAALEAEKLEAIEAKNKKLAKNIEKLMQ